ncbi:MAG: ferritin family protein, partial [Anaerolineae bacterium]
MSEEAQSVLQALEMAIDTQKRGREFYQKVAKETDYPEARQMFLSLAEDEMEHLNWLKAQRDSLLSKGEWLPYE